jgi:catechol 2,3-dioxygenase-like lactoylglutathione lyase family enzyme
MTTGPLSRCGPIRQCAYLVRDLEAAVEWWAALGVGPFLSMHRAKMQGYRLRGEPVEPVLTLAFANSGDLQIELIATHDDVPSVFTEALAAGREGAHHLAWWVDDWAAWERLAGAAGLVPVTDGDGGGMARFAYYDLGGPLLAELMELNDSTRWLVATVRAAHDTWDGTEPLRNLF